jgi:putative transposase
VEKGRFKIAGVTVSFRHGRWQVSVYGKATAFHSDRRTTTKDRRPRGTSTVGVDLGVRTQAVAATADGQIILEREGVKAYQHQLRKLRRASRSYARTKRGSKGREKAAEKLARIHARVVGLRRNALHQLTTELATSHDVIVIEDLDVAAMLRSGRGARGVADQTFGEFRRQLTYKTGWYGTELVVADRWFASSKTCSDCGEHNAELKRGQAAWVCPACGVSHDRDVNAAINLARWPATQLEAAA